MVLSSSVSCCQLKPAAPPASRGASTAQLRRACVAAAAACAVLATAGPGGDVVGASTVTDATYAAARAPAPARWSDRRQCPPWRANSLENIVPENLPRPSARQRLNRITAVESAPPPASSPNATVPFLALRSGMGCFSL
ncbi:hypothetical protein GUJ93_ZPchr0010g8389 [Zizania palustris]|uniref:Uncharacterized protein n=1 Tax=Zizania palustris TaxID=103762 RepID=A0A8J5W9U3_ZIZPA|nr:hypothetical protein GUJ93_ZPchr0010g8389 [Zizania palustris]